jgi:hypothetical protein
VAIWLVLVQASFAQSRWLNFDEVPDGTPIQDEYPGVHFPDRAVVVNLGESASSQPNVLRKTGSMAGDPAPMIISFDAPMSYVRLRAGNLAATPATLTLRAYSTLSGGSPVATSSVDLEAMAPFRRWLEICRVGARDIRRVEIEQSGNGVEFIDDLEFEDLGTVASRRIGFDDRILNEVVRDQYPGVHFPDQVEAIDWFALGVNVSSMPMALRKRISSETDPGPMRIIFDSPQGFVGMRVGYPADENNGGLLRVMLRAYNAVSGGSLVAAAESTFAGVTSVDHYLEVCRWPQWDIRRVELQYDRIFAGFEALDDLVFGPNLPPDPGPDTFPPYVGITQPRHWERFLQTDPSVSSISVIVAGNISEPRSLSRVQVERRNLDGTNVTRNSDVPFTGSAPGYGFSTSISLLPGQNRIIVTATDTAGNSSSDQVDVAYEPPRGMTLGRPAPATGNGRIVLRDRDPALAIPGTRVTIPGSDLHPRVTPYLRRYPPAAPSPFDTTLYRAAVVNRDPGWNWIEVEAPELLREPAGTEWEWVLIDEWARPDYTPWLNGGLFTLQDAPYARLHAFGFQNVGQSYGFDDMHACFGETVFLEDPILHCRLPNPISHTLFFAIFKIWLDNSGGSCVGMASTTALFRDGHLNEEWYERGARPHFPSGFLAGGSPAMYSLPAICSSDVYPLNLWAEIQRNHAAQTSDEYVNRVLSQLRGGGFSADGNPVARLAEVRANPRGYAICMIPRIGTGHCVTPYRVEDVSSTMARIWVYDPNHPYDNRLAETNGVNVAALNSYIDIDTAANTFTFCLDSGSASVCGGSRLWSGTGLYTIPLSLWREPRHPVSVGTAIDALRILVFGAADGFYQTTDGGKWGWLADGSFVDALAGAVSVTPLGSSTVETRNVPLLVPLAHTQLAASANTKGGDYLFHADHGGAAVQLEVFNAPPGGTDPFEVFRPDPGSGDLGFAWKSPRDHARCQPKIGLTFSSNKCEVLRWAGWERGPGEGLRYRTWKDQRAVEYRNESVRPVSLRLLIDAADGNAFGESHTLFDGIEMPAGGTHIVRLYAWPPVSKVQLESDADGDGVFEGTNILAGYSVRVQDVPNGADCNHNGILDEVDIAFGTSQDKDGNGVPDECNEIGVQLLSILKDEVTLRINGTKGVVVTIEQSPDLRAWEAVHSVELTSNENVVTFSAPSECSHRFFRARQSHAP